MEALFPRLPSNKVLFNRAETFEKNMPFFWGHFRIRKRILQDGYQRDRGKYVLLVRGEGS